MVIQELSSKIVFIDTAPLIYFIEGHSVYQRSLSELFDFNSKGGFTFVTSSITLLGVLVKPIREGKVNIAARYKEILTSASGIEINDVTTIIAELAAQLRATYNLKTPDAIQLAMSINVGADYFLTNDTRLQVVQEVRVLTVADIE